MVTSLTKMKLNEIGTVYSIENGLGMAERIQNMGVRIGKKIKKIAGYHNRGPQTVLVGHFKIAIGFGMSEKIIVEVE